MSKALNDKKALNKKEMADSRANCNGDILVVGSAIATIKVIIVMIIIILTLTRICFFAEQSRAEQGLRRKTAYF